MTSPRFAPTQDRRFRLPVSLFRLFGIWPLPMQWTYHTEADLHEALKGAAKLLHLVLSIFEPEAALMGRHTSAASRNLRAPRVSAKEAYELARPIVKTWLMMQACCESARTWSPRRTFFVSGRPAGLRMGGALAKNGGWWMQFHSRKKQENLYVTIPCYGPVTQTRLDAPAGRHWPSDVDQIHARRVDGF